MGMHVNGIRIHLETLARAGLVIREREHLARGRPRDRWRIAPDARPDGVEPTGYAELSLWLMRALVTHGAKTGDLESVGREIGRELATPGDGPPAERFFDALVSFGFGPERSAGGEQRTKYCLRNCPYREAAREQPALVCGLHRGITRGLLDRLAPDAQLGAFTMKDPDAAGCEIELLMAG
jgi:predicted ArsR family transcriptional regulator